MQHHQVNSVRERKLAPVSNSKGNTQFYFEEDYIILTDPAHVFITLHKRPLLTRPVSVVVSLTNMFPMLTGLMCKSE